MSYYWVGSKYTITVNCPRHSRVTEQWAIKFNFIHFDFYVNCPCHSTVTEQCNVQVHLTLFIVISMLLIFWCSVLTYWLCSQSVLIFSMKFLWTSWHGSFFSEFFNNHLQIFFSHFVLITRSIDWCQKLGTENFDNFPLSTSSVLLLHRHHSTKCYTILRVSCLCHSRVTGRPPIACNFIFSDYCIDSLVFSVLNLKPVIFSIMWPLSD